MSVRLGFDIGGTFTDLFAVKEDGSLIQEKVPTTPADFSRGGANGIQAVITKHDVDPSSIEYLSHGTTVATNAMIEQEGATTGLLTTKGFRDIVDIGREKRNELYETSPKKTPSFTRRRHRLGVQERIDANGEVLESLDEDEVKATTEKLESAGVESIAISFLNAYKNPVHEQRAAKIIRDESNLPVTCSTDVMPERKEYERTLSTIINGYVEPVLNRYIDRLETRLAQKDVETELHLMQANGGIVKPENIAGRSLRLINSGPAAGVIGAKHFGSLSGISNIITLDVGGTSADTCVVKDGRIETTTTGEINDIPLQFPQVDVRTVGAGGGSIAWVDGTGVVKVGPKSSGAVPGPACYGHGGNEPTVTDAALLLGYLDPQYFLGGEMQLNRAAAESVVTTLAAAVDMEPLPLADGILDIATTNMAQTVRLVTIEKGYDPRDFALTCYGGAGPMFGTRLARELGISKVLIPAAPGVLSATGLLAADKQFDVSQTEIIEIAPENSETIASLYESLISEADIFSSGDNQVSRSVDLRYTGQSFQLTIDVPDGNITGETIAALRSRFIETYEGIYGQAWEDKPIEAVTWRLKLSEPTPTVNFERESPAGTVDEAIKTTRSAYWDGEFEDHTVYDRYQIPHGTTLTGPAIIEEKESTTYVDPDSVLSVDETGNLIIELID
ncbi:hydantoinase/oxoprolinase family protein [Natrialbaceae archaeon A-CW2]